MSQTLHNQLIDFLVIREELEKLGPFNRMYTYGPIKLLSIKLSQVFNSEVYNHFEKFLITLDDTIVFFNNETNYKVQVNRTDLGEFFNVATVKSESNPDAFFRTLMGTVNHFMLAVLRSLIDEMYDNDFNIQNITSVQSLSNTKYSSIAMESVKVLIKEYLNLLSSKPTALSLLSYLKRYNITSSFISEYTSSLETQLIDYIRTKKSIQSNNTVNMVNIK